MPYELRFDAALTIKLLLEREDHQHPADVLTHAFNASLLPGPELRTDVVNDGNAALVKFAGEPQIEIWEVDEHRRIGPAPLRLAHHLAKAAIDGWNVLDDLDDADFGDLASVRQQLAAGRAHLLAADAEEIDLSIRLPLGDLFAQGLHQLCAIKFARCLSCGDEDSHSGIMTGGSCQPSTAADFGSLRSSSPEFLRGLRSSVIET